MADITANLELWLKLDSNFLDSSGNFRHGTPTLMNFDDDATDGKVGGGITKDGAGHYIACPSVGLEVTDKQSIAFWMRFPSVGFGTNDIWIVGSRNSATPDGAFSVWNTDDGRIFARLGSTNATPFDFNDMLTDDLYHHYVVTFDGVDQIKYYIDNIPKATQTTTPTQWDSTNENYIGKWINAGDNNGVRDLDDIRIYSEDLSEDLDKLADLFAYRGDANISSFSLGIDIGI